MKTIPLSVAEAAIDLEPELSDEMPDEMWEYIRNDKEAMIEVMRAAISLTKGNIKSRLHALSQLE